MRQAPRKRSGPAARFMGYRSTIVRILQWGCGRGPGLRRPPADGDGWFCFGLRPRPTCPPSNVFGNRGTHHTPAEATPPAPCAASVASLRWRIGTLASLPPGTGTGTGTVFDCMLLSFSAEFRGFRRGAVVYPSLPVVSRRLPVAYPSLSRRLAVAHPSLSRMAPRSLCHTTACAPVPAILGWMRAWGTCPDPPAQGVSLWIPPVHMYAAGFMGIL